jgi:hypothetical protein
MTYGGKSPAPAPLLRSLPTPGGGEDPTGAVNGPPACSPITTGALDARGHPNVGTLVAYLADGPIPLCSGVLVGERAFLTAAHCIDRLMQLGAEALPGVSFAPVFDPARAEVVRGTPVVHPQYDPELGVNDLAVISLDEPVRSLEPARVVEEGFFDRMNPRWLERATFVAVGYGTTDPGERWNRGTRRSAVEGFVGLVGVDEWRADQDYWLATSGPSVDGHGTPCFGDSGGPHFLGDRVVAITDFVWCGLDGGEAVHPGDAYNEATRLDLPGANAFVRSFIGPGACGVRH